MNKLSTVTEEQWDAMAAQIRASNKAQKEKK